jgi:predicted TIM-barrel fold metal-dependent hydrolase
VFDHPEIQDWYNNYLSKKETSYTDINTRLEEFKTLKIDHQVLNVMGISLNINYQIPKAVGRRVMQMYNQHMSEIVAKHTCFSANIWLALQDLDASLEELELRSKQNFFAVFLSETPAWGFMPDYDCLFERIAALGLPVYLHQTEILDTIDSDVGLWAEQLAILTQLWPQNHFWKRTLASLIVGGVLDRYPDLKIVLAERDIDWIQDFQTNMLALGFPDPLPYFQRNFWFTTEPEMPNFLANAELLGWDRVLFATDWPHDRDMGGANALKDVDTVLNLTISDTRKQQLFELNYSNLRNR